MIDNTALNQFIQDHIQQVLQSQVDNTVQDFVVKTIDNLTMDSQWLNKIETLVIQSFRDRAAKLLTSIDLNQAIREHIDASLSDWQDRLLASYRSGGIVDQAQSLQLSVTDRGVAVGNRFMAVDAELDGDLEVKGSITVNNLAVRGTVNVDNLSWDGIAVAAADKVRNSLNEQWQKDLVQEVIAISQRQGIEFDQVLIQGQPLVQGGTLSAGVTRSHLCQVGTLESLTVTGGAEFYDTLHVNNHRVGINTNAPESALSVWDEEVCVLTGKHKQNHAYVGTSRNQALSLGVNRTAFVTIDTDGLVSVNRLRIDRWQLGHSAQVPGWSGTRGDFVFNSDPKPDAPFAWVCLGAFRWQALKAA